jgi:molybdopterin molybdotransferase
MRPGRPMAVGLLPRPARSLEEKAGFGPHGKPIVSYQSGSKSTAMSEHSRDFAALFGLPGNPVAVMVNFLVFVRPALLQMMGCTQPALPLLKAKCSDAIRKKAGRTEYQRGIVSTTSAGTLQVRLTGSQGSGMLSSMTQANGLIVLHHDQGNVLAGDEVDVMMFDGAI